MCRIEFSVFLFTKPKSLISTLNSGFFAITFSSDISYIPSFIVNFLFRSKNAPGERLGVFFFICMLMSAERHVRFVG